MIRQNVAGIERSEGCVVAPKYNRLEITDFHNFKTTAIDHSAIPPRRNLD